MKNSCRIFSPAAVAGVLALLAASPQAASAQAVGGFLNPGGGRAATSPSFPSQPVQGGSAMQPGAVFVRPGGSLGPSPGYGQPGNNHYTFNRPVFNPPAYNNAPVYNSNAPAYNNGSVYGNGPGYGNSQLFRREYSSGPAANVPNAFEGSAAGSDRRIRPGRFSGGTSNNGYPSNGYSNTEDTRPTRPIGSINRTFDSGSFGRSDFQITTPQGWRHVPTAVYNNNYIYNNYNSSAVVVSAPPLLGGYYYGNYCDTYAPTYTYPSIYSVYAGFPQYIFNASPSVVIVGQPIYQPYVTGYLPFDTPNYSVTYNQNNYYVASEGRARVIEGGGAPARAALKSAYPADSYQAAFADIAQAWNNGDIAPLRKHVRDADTRVSVLLNKKYSYSIASGDFVQITRDALDRLHTVSFDFTRLRKSKIGDVTAYGTHVYRIGDSQSGGDAGTVPFDQSSGDTGDTNPPTASPYAKADDPAAGAAKTVYVSYTLRHRDSQWYIIEVDSSDRALVSEQ